MECVLLAGQIACGKSSVASEFAARTGGMHVRVRNALAQTLGTTPDDRHRLQVEGADLDRRTNGMWLVEYLEALRDEHDAIVVDAMRTERQTLPVLRSLPSLLVYLEASPETRRRRFMDAVAAGDPVKRSMSLSEAMRHPTESDVLQLRRRATLVISTDDMSVEDTVKELIEATGAHAPRRA